MADQPDLTREQQNAWGEAKSTNPFTLDDADDAVEFKVGKFTYAESKKISRILQRTGMSMVFSDEDLDRLEALIFPKVTFELPGATAGKMVLSEGNNEELAFGGNPVYGLQVVMRAIAIELGRFLVGRRSG